MCDEGSGMSHGISRSTNLELRAQLRTPRQIRFAGERPAQTTAAKRRNAAMPLAAVLAMPRAKAWRVLLGHKDDAKDGTKGQPAPKDGIRA